MTTVTPPTDPTPPPGAPGPAAWLPLPGRYTVAPGRSLAELTALCGPLPVRRRRLSLAAASLTVSDTEEHAAFRLKFERRPPQRRPHPRLRPRVRRTVQLTGDLAIGGTGFPVLLRLRVVERADDRLLCVGVARPPSTPHA